MGLTALMLMVMVGLVTVKMYPIAGIGEAMAMLVPAVVRTMTKFLLMMVFP